jgi:hypothetical protein
MRADFTPYCETPDGCPIEDLAADPYLDEACNMFVRMRSLYELNSDSETYERMRSQLDLDDDTLLEMEMIYSKWRQAAQKKP